jgi:uncharacterized integral membrane protein (TIGR00698 family)
VTALQDRRTDAAAASRGNAAPVLIGLGAYAVGAVLPVIGAPVIAVVVGLTVSRWVRPPAAGLRFAKERLLQLAIVLLGAQLSLGEIASVGAASLPVLLGTLAGCLALAWLVGRRLGIGRDLRTLIGVGTGICGASAIAAVSPVLRARGNDVAYALSTIFLFNVAAVLVFPPLGHLLGLDQQAFGLFAGTAVNDTSSVVAAATSYGSAAADHAVVVKLTRSLMIVPICAGLAALARTDRRPIRELVPWFLVGFLAVAALRSAALIPQVAAGPLRTTAGLLIAIALAAIGLSTDVGALRAAGFRPLALGFVLWVAVASTSLALQYLFL